MSIEQNELSNEQYEQIIEDELFAKEFEIIKNRTHHILEQDEEDDEVNYFLTK